MSYRIANFTDDHSGLRIHKRRCCWPSIVRCVFQVVINIFSKAKNNIFYCRCHGSFVFMSYCLDHLQLITQFRMVVIPPDIVNFTIAMSAFGYTFTKFASEVIALTHISWVLVSGALPIVLLTMNTSVRKIIKHAKRDKTVTRPQGSRKQATTRTATRTTQVNTRTRVSSLNEPADTIPA
ncbi:hypothetical protein M3Y96_00604500 [Aphelenchoides besseyi]|nr:hypothetical protein M3Y96_00604500 [Aphelenchoides besseyi]